MTATPGWLATSLGTFRVVARHRAIGRAVVAYGGWTFGDWAGWTALLVYAFQLGGAPAAGGIAVALLVPAAVVGPLLAASGDRVPRERVLVLSYVAQAVTMAAVALAMSAGASVVVVGVLGAITYIAITIGRPAHNALLPFLARTPEELTAANVASNTIQTVAILIAPAAAGVLLAVWGPAAVFVVTAVVCAGAAALVGPIRTERSTIARSPVRLAPSDVRADGGESDRAHPGEVAPGLLSALRVLLGHASTRTIVLLIAAGSVIEGSLDVIAVVLALDLLHLGQGGVGLLGSAVGAGGLAGAAAAASLVGRAHLRGPFVGGLLVWSLPIAIVGVAPVVGVAVTAFALAGVGRSLMDVAGRTLLQRVAPEAALSGVFGALEGLHVLMLAGGSVLVPGLIVAVGPRLALVLVGCWLPLVLVATWRVVRAADEHGVVHVRELRRLRALPMFAPLSPPTIERLAANLVPVTAPAGAVLIREGDPGDRFYLIDAGTAEVTIAGAVVRRLGPGDGFGEIALVRDVPRTATVRALDDVELLTLGRTVFLAALTGHAGAATVADELVRERLGDGGTPALGGDETTF